jgi:hypothetical protein
MAMPFAKLKQLAYAMLADVVKSWQPQDNHIDFAASVRNAVSEQRQLLDSWLSAGVTVPKSQDSGAVFWRGSCAQIG